MSCECILAIRQSTPSHSSGNKPFCTRASLTRRGRVTVFTTELEINRATGRAWPCAKQIELLAVKQTAMNSDAIKNELSFIQAETGKFFFMSGNLPGVRRNWALEVGG